MKVIFLDIDGVLNCRWTKQRNAHGTLGIDPSMVNHLNAIIAATGAECVLSSIWRMAFGLDETRKELEAAGFTGKLVAETEGMCTHRREEIQNWLAENRFVKSFVVLDDSDDAMIPGRSVQTTMEHGLTANDARLAIHILNDGA